MLTTVYCKNCVLPSTRPGLEIHEDGICNACKIHAQRKDVNWEQRRSDFESLVTRFARTQADGFNCLVPVSGGKDSIYQVHKLKFEYGLNPLCVTYKTPFRTELGEQNLKALQEMGVTHLDISFNPVTERKLLKHCLLKFGAAGIPTHMGMFAACLKTAMRYDIGLVVWGENSAAEYGGTAEDARNPYMSRQWCLQYGCLQGLDPLSYAGDGISSKEMLQFSIPDDEDFANSKIVAVFLGHYFPWDSAQNYVLAQKYGFKSRNEGPVLGLYNYADIDCDLIPIHHFAKWYKFGFGRTFDNASVEIRNHRMTREQALVAIAGHRDLAWTKAVTRLCEYLGWRIDEFVNCMRSHAQPQLWESGTQGLVLSHFIDGSKLTDTSLYEWLR